MIKKAFTGAAAILLIAGVAMAQEKTKTTAKSKKDSAATCKTTAKGKSCCQQPSKTASLRMAAANKTKTKAQR